jgi:hypothetical protein
LSSVSPWPSAGVSLTTFTVMTAIWFLIVQWVSAGFGGYVAGRLRARWAELHTDEAYFPRHRAGRPGLGGRGGRERGAVGGGGGGHGLGRRRGHRRGAGRGPGRHAKHRRHRLEPSTSSTLCSAPTALIPRRAARTRGPRRGGFSPTRCGRAAP